MAVDERRPATDAGGSGRIGQGRGGVAQEGSIRSKPWVDKPLLTRLVGAAALAVQRLATGWIQSRTRRAAVARAPTGSAKFLAGCRLVHWPQRRQLLRQEC